MVALGWLCSLFMNGLWVAAVIPFISTVSMQIKGKQGFVLGFLGMAILWLLLILLKDVPNHHILSTRMAGVLSLPNAALFILVNVLLGGLIGGLSGWSGVVMNWAFRASPNPSQGGASRDKK
ncbi:hypothetical protein CAP35_11400 [Chitinophagaceae bacterium IBVUCB1]|nr:hypothetical protein CAP35_11400 [Chitinophagaceae bacterium IBVUCB1]